MVQKSTVLGVSIAAALLGVVTTATTSFGAKSNREIALTKAPVALPFASVTTTSTTTVPETSTTSTTVPETSTTSTTVPETSTTSTTVPAGNEVTAISSGGFHTCAVVSGAAKCWGVNWQGRLGDGTTTTSATPVQVSGLTSGVTAISAGSATTCAVVNGAAKCWGQGASYSLGDGLGTGSSVPVQVSGLTSGVTAITVGLNFACAVVSGAAKCWGGNASGQLGNGTTTLSATPVQVSGLTSGVTAISATNLHVCAVVSGAAKCWGANNVYQLGQFLGVFSSAYSTTPVTVDGLSSGVTGVAAGLNHSCAIVDGAAKCWGANGGNHLFGDGTYIDSVTPVQVSGLTSGVTAISAGQFGSCAVVNGAAKCWGDNSYGRLGVGDDTSYTFVPVQVVGLTTGVSSISTGDYHNCAVVGTTAKCWGGNFYGALGDGTTTNRFAPVDVLL